MIKEPDISNKIIIELEPRRFGSKPHQKIYQAIKKCILKNKKLDLHAIGEQLGEHLEQCGGFEYLSSLNQVVDILGLNDWEALVRKIDDAGRLRELSKLHSDYTKDFDDLEVLLDRTDNVDEYIQSYASKLEGISQTVSTNYQPISVAVNDARKLINQGFCTDIIPCGWPNLSNYMIPRPKSIGAVIGISSMGKTQFCLQLAYGVGNFLKLQKQKGVVAINSLETPGDRLALRLAYMIGGFNSINIMQGRFSSIDEEKINEYLDYIATLPIVFNDSPDLSTEQFVTHATIQGVIDKRVLGISDYLELFSDKKDTEELRISNAARNIRRVCWRTGSCEIAISQVNNSVMSTMTKIAGLDKARYSGAIKHIIDWGIEIWNPIQMKKANISFTCPPHLSEDRAYALVEKNKDYSVGQVALDWIPEFMRFRDMALPMNKVFDFDIEMDEF